MSHGRGLSRQMSMNEKLNLGAAAVFDPLRPKLIRAAYRMLGSLADSEDVVQDAFMRWLGTDRDAVREPEAFLRRVVTRLCLDFLKSARTQVRAARPRFPVPKEHGLKIAEAFFTASRRGEMAHLRSLLATNVAIYSDGGGKRPAATKPIIGIEQVMRAHIGLARMFAKGPSQMLRYGLINGLPGFVTREADNELQTTALQIEAGRIVAIYIMRNPDKLRRIH